MPTNDLMNGFADFVEASIETSAETSSLGIMDELPSLGAMNLVHCEDSNLRTQLLEYYKWQVIVTLLVGVTYFRILKASIIKGTHYSGIEFANNQVVPKKNETWREQLTLMSWNGVLLALCSLMGALRVIFRLLPIFYQSNCYVSQTMTMSTFPGASFAIFDAVMSLACLCVLLQITFLTLIFRTVPGFILRTLPHLYKRCCRRVEESVSSEPQWKPNCHQMDYKLDEYNSLEDGPNIS